MPGAARVIVEHATPLPAWDGAAAALIAEAVGRALGASPFEIVRLRDPDRAFPQPGSAEHVTADGCLVINSVLWAERALGRNGGYRETAELEDSATQPQIVALNPALVSPGTMTALRGRLAGDPSALWLAAREQGEKLALVIARSDGSEEVEAELHRDRFGRWRLRDRGLAETLGRHFGVAVAFPGVGDEAANRSPPVRIVLVGEGAHLRDVYPGVLAALGDAADGSMLAADVTIVSPRDAGFKQAVGNADGIVLPGGSDLGQVPGQVAATWTAWQQGIPVLGLCLGMQAMAVAVARNLAGIPDAALEESEPAAPNLLFRRLHDAEGRPYHRLGAEAVRVRPGTKASAWFGNGTEERFNQRYTLAKDYVAPLERAGLQVSAASAKDGLSDVIEAPAHPFFVGFQSHPELISRPGAPHPAMDAFLRAAQTQRSGRP